MEWQLACAGCPSAMSEWRYAIRGNGDRALESVPSSESTPMQQHFAMRLFTAPDPSAAMCLERTSRRSLWPLDLPITDRTPCSKQRKHSPCCNQGLTNSEFGRINASSDRPTPHHLLPASATLVIAIWHEGRSNMRLRAGPCDWLPSCA
jgi:hypothetical protein